MFEKWSTCLQDTTNSLQNQLRKGLQGIPKLGGVAMLTASILIGGGLGAAADAATYYLSPTGSNANAGTSTSAPWKTFGFAIPKLKPGDTLVLRNGTYIKSNSGYPQILCGTNAVSGTSSQRITIKAENERRAFIDGDGSTYPFQMVNCAYWTIDGLRIEGADDADTKANNGHTVSISTSNNLIFRHNLVRFNNRYKNGNIVYLNTTDSLIEENEVYSFHRNGMGGGNRNTYRRNYLNSRGYADIPGGQSSSHSTTRGDGAYIFYPSSDNLVENNISEGNSSGFNLIAAGPTKNNKFYGNISYRDLYGFDMGAKGYTTDKMPHNNLFVDSVALNYTYIGLFSTNAEGTQCRNCTFLGGGTGKSGIHANVSGTYPGDGFYSLFATNILAMNHRGTGIYIASGIDQWSIDEANSFSGNPNFRSYSGNYFQNTQSVDPQLGACRVFIPEGSPMKGAGKNGADIGANVLYRYENGVLTTKPLWDPTTGQFPCGAIIPGVNDISGASCFDVHKRLNVNANGCSLPASYSQQSIASAAPQKVRILGVD